MVSVRHYLGLAALAAGLVAGSGAALAADAARGKILFTQKYGCFQCHGEVGQGSPVTGPKLAPNPMPYEALSAFVRTTNRAMPPYKEAILPEADLQDMYAYLQSIPFGATRSYSQVAKAIGQPTASRAVARACATNPVAVAIPCHRVVRESGEMGGYRWGIERKKSLLAIENR